MADAYLEAVLAARPQGPYLFLGYCFGGLVAYEMGVRLAQRGGEAAWGVMLDSELRPATDQVPEGAELLIHELGPVITLTPEELAGLDSERQYALAVDKLKRAELAPPDYTTDDLRRIMAMFQACRYAWRDYRPSVRPSDARGRIILCRAREELAKDGSDPTMGWDRLVGRGLEVLVVPGDHTSMIARPQVDVLAAYLRPLLR